MANVIGVLNELRNSTKFRWKIPNFSSLPFSGSNDCYSSNTFRFINTDYRLRLYGPQSNCHSVLLSNESGISKNVTCSLRILKANGTYFGSKTTSLTLRHWFRNFINLPALQERESELLPDGALTLVCSFGRLSNLNKAKTSISKRQAFHNKKLPVVQGSGMLNKKELKKTPHVIKTAHLLSHKSSTNSAANNVSGTFRSPAPSTSYDYSASSQPTSFGQLPYLLNAQNPYLFLPPTNPYNGTSATTPRVRGPFGTASGVSATRRQQYLGHQQPFQGCQYCGSHTNTVTNAGVEAATNTTASSVVHRHDKILQDFKQLFLKQENCDVVLRVKGEEFRAHKAILAARSPVFASTFGDEETVDIDDCDPSIFPDFLCFLYCDTVNPMSGGKISSLLAAAEKYEVPDLQKLCVELLKMNLSVKTFCETVTLALQCNETEFINFTTDFFIKNAMAILVSAEWQSFAAANPEQSNELFIKFVKNVGGPYSSFLT